MKDLLLLAMKMPPPIRMDTPLPLLAVSLVFLRGQVMVI